MCIRDSILYKGMIASDDLVVRRKKTIVKRMRNYLDYICNCDYLTTSLLPMGDGVAISYKAVSYTHLGLGVIEKLNEMELEKMPKIIVLSAVGQDKITQTAINLGADYYLSLIHI